MGQDLFDAFVKFVACLDQYKGAEVKSIKLYNHLLSKITEQHGGAISRNVSLIKNFIEKNEEAILSHDIASLKDCPSISYSDKVFLNVQEILQSADKDTQNVIWKHLLTLKIKADDAPNFTAIEKLKMLNNSGDTAGMPSIESMSSFFSSEGSFGNILDSIGGPTLSSSIKQIMESESFKNVITEVKEKVESGEIDIPKLQENLMNSGLMDSIGGLDMMNTMGSNNQPE